ncbi:MAG: hypothetical protein ABSH06_14370 [Thermodesulfobacteriota bacterium]|jgi:hypothetical protein
MSNGNIAGQYGPYYRSSQRSKEAEKEALGMPALRPDVIAGERYGELSAYLGESERKSEFAQNMGIQQGYLGISSQQLRNQQKQAQSQKTSNIVKGVSGLTGTALAVGKETGLFSAASTALGLGPSVATPALTSIPGASIPMMGLEVGQVPVEIGAEATTSALASAGTSAGEIVGGVFSTIAEIIGDIFGCCYTFLEGEMLTKNVRRYRDEHYDKKTSPISFGYRWMSKWLVPRMKSFKSVKAIVKWIMLKPLANYADWYYGDNAFGWIFYPLKVFWTNAWRLAGLIIQQRIKVLITQRA